MIRWHGSKEVSIGYSPSYEYNDELSRRDNARGDMGKE